MLLSQGADIICNMRGRNDGVLSLWWQEADIAHSMRGCSGKGVIVIVGGRGAGIIYRMGDAVVRE